MARKQKYVEMKKLYAKDLKAKGLGKGDKKLPPSPPRGKEVVMKNLPNT